MIFINCCRLTLDLVNELKGKKIYNNCIRLSSSLTLTSNHPTFPRTKILYIPCYCNHDYVFYTINSMTFPSLEEIYLDDMVPDVSLFDKFPLTRIYFTSKPKDFDERFQNRKNVKVLNGNIDFIDQPCEIKE